MVNQFRNNQDPAESDDLIIDPTIDPMTDPTMTYPLSDEVLEAELTDLPDDDSDLEDEWDDEADSEDEADWIDDNYPSYGTGFYDQPGFSVRGSTLNDRADQFNEASPILTGGDVDANWEQADAVGDESVGGSVATPDMDIVDELGKAVGLEMDDRAFLRTNEILEQRDQRRWELDPDSAEEEQL